MLKPHHVLHHTLIQQMKNVELANDEIAECFGWSARTLLAMVLKNVKREETEMGLCF